MEIKPECYECADKYNVNNGKCASCEWGIECMQNFMLYYNKKLEEMK